MSIGTNQVNQSQLSVDLTSSLHKTRLTNPYIQKKLSKANNTPTMMFNKDIPLEKRINSSMHIADKNIVSLNIKQKLEASNITRN